MDASSFDAAAAVLPVRLRTAALALPAQYKERAEEIRLRAGREMTVVLAEGEIPAGPRVEAEDLETLCDLATEFSRYAAAETIREGFLPVRGGCRVGLCGTVVMKEGVSVNLRDLSSAAVRICRQQRGIAGEVQAALTEDGRFVSTLILSPPGGGKTTLLRDLVRSLSNGGARVALIDERGEVAAVCRGQPQMDVGCRTDVLDGCPKALGIPMVLRAMNPQIIAVDEIAVREDLRAVSMAAGCGVSLLATIHAADIGELAEKPLYRELAALGVFRRAVVIRREDGRRRYETEVLA